MCTENTGRRLRNVEFSRPAQPTERVSAEAAAEDFAPTNEQSAILAERERMARELHDTMAQGFTLILLQIEVAKSLLGESGHPAIGPLERAQEFARESLAEARRAVWALRPRALGESDLPTALAWLVRDMALGTGVEVEFTTRGASRALTVEIETNLLRIIQEAVTNALRHARARNIHVKLTFSDDLLKASIEDDGRGFSLRAARAGDGFGLISMRERAESLAGKLLVSSHPARGTRVLAKVPLPKP